ncbi:MAG: sigma-70 family RNA polymerase sigma factor [Bacteroidota bacterium]
MKKVLSASTESSSELKPDKMKLFKELYCKNEKALLGISSKYYPKDPREGLQLFAVKLWEMPPQQLNKIKAKGIGYLVTMYKNMLFDQLRKEKRYKKALKNNLDQPEEPKTDNDKYEMAKEQVLRVAEGLIKKELHLNVLRLMLDGYTNKEIAQKLKQKAKTIATIKLRIKTKLKGLLYH